MQFLCSLRRWLVTPCIWKSVLSFLLPCCAFYSPYDASCNSSPLTVGCCIFITHSAMAVLLLLQASIRATFVPFLKVGHLRYQQQFCHILIHLAILCIDSIWLGHSYMSVINLLTDSVSFCCPLLNFVHSCIIF